MKQEKYTTESRANASRKRNGWMPGFAVFIARQTRGIAGFGKKHRRLKA